MNLIPQFVKNAFRRSGSSLENPSMDMLRLFGGNPSVAGVDVNENTAMSVSSVSRVSAISPKIVPSSPSTSMRTCNRAGDGWLKAIRCGDC